MNSVDSNLQFIFYLKFSMRKDVVDYSPWFPTGKVMQRPSLTLIAHTQLFILEKKKKCQKANSQIQCQSEVNLIKKTMKTVQNLREEPPSPMLTGAGRSWCSCLPPPVCLSVPLLAMGRESYMWPCWKNSRKTQLSHPWLDPYSLVCCLSWVSKPFLAIL